MDRETEDSLTNDNQYEKEKLADPFAQSTSPTTLRKAKRRMMVKILVDALLQRNKAQQSFAISAVTESPMIEDVAELAHLQIEQNLGQARHDVPVTYWAAELEEDWKVWEFISTGCERVIPFTVHPRYYRAMRGHAAELSWGELNNIMMALTCM